MTPDLYTTRLYWCAPRGVARLNGTSVPLTGPPLLNGEAVAMIDCTPEVRAAMVMCKHQGWREMTAAEIQQCQQLLQQLVDAAAAQAPALKAAHG